MERRDPGGLPAYAWPALDGTGVEAYVSTRAGGVSTGSYASLNLGLHVGDDPVAVVENRSRLARALGVGLGDLVFSDQVHQPHVAVVTEAERGRGARDTADALPATDAVVTAVTGLVLVIQVADCVPLVLVDPVRRLLACVHAGWGGTVRGVTPAAVARLVELGSDPGDVVAAIGPSIAPEAYQVGADVVAAAEAALGAHAGEVVRPDGTGRWSFDLWAANRLQLVAAGVPARNIALAGLDTGPGTPFFSHRREGPTGRFAVAARLTTA
nr:peptidoglycan editing factor PgeF [Motilibacter aurantiacus]